jgi:hypothetical protein
MFLYGNAFRTNLDQFIPYSDSLIQFAPESFGDTGRYFTYKTQFAFFLAAEIDNLQYMEVYSKWNAVVQQVTYSLIAVDPEITYRAYVQMVLPFSQPAHYTIWVTRDSPSLSRVTDVSNSIGGKDRIDGLQSQIFVYYMMFATSGSGALTQFQLQGIVNQFV